MRKIHHHTELIYMQVDTVIATRYNVSVLVSIQLAQLPRLAII